MCILLVPSIIRQSTEASKKKKKKVHEAIKMWLYFLKGQSCHFYATLLQIFEQLLASSYELTIGHVCDMTLVINILFLDI